jgi:hypothetical protein
MAVDHRVGVYHAQLRRSITEERLPIGSRSFEPFADRQANATKALKALLFP